MRVESIAGAEYLRISRDILSVPNLSRLEGIPVWEFFLAREITVDTAFRACAAMGTYLSTHAIASQAQSRCLNGNLTRLDSAAKAARGVFKLVFGLPF